jgi:lysophospholipase L1-like esterase
MTLKNYLKYKANMKNETPVCMVKTTHWMICLFIFAQFYLLLSPAFALGKNEIIIDSSSQALVAPEGQHYQWYENGEQVIGGNTKTLVVTKSGNYTVQVVDEMGRVTEKNITVAVTATGAIYRIFTIGDSTVQDYNAGYYPRKGWGQVLPFFFNTANVQVVNKAVGGTSSKSYYDNQWPAVRDALKAGDFVFIQFGINDAAADVARHTVPSTTFKAYLTKFVNETKAKGAVPVLVSTLVRNAWNVDGVTVYPAYHDYPVATRQLASEINCPLIDLNLKATALLQSVGKTYSTRFWYNNYLPGEYPNYPNGNTDDVHFQEMGAIEMAKLIVQGVSELSSNANVSKLIPFINPQYPVTVTKNNSSAGIVTRTTSYPAGPTITLKEIPNTGHVFSKWTDASNTQVSKNPMYTFVMTQNAKTYNSYFDLSASNQLPAVNITAPATNTSFTSPASITVTANASDVDGTVSKVEFYSGATLLGSDAVAPYGFTWTNVAAGTYVITAKATDNSGGISTSSGISLKVNNPTSTTTTIQAESACLVNGILSESTNAGFHGSGYVNTDNKVGAVISWSLNSQVAQSAMLTFRYANASANDRRISVNVNGVSQVVSLSFLPTGAWTTWNTVSVQVNLALGNNQIQFIALSAEGAANIDEFSFSTSGIAAGVCSPLASIQTAALVPQASIAPNPSSGTFILTVLEPVLTVTVNNNTGHVEQSFGPLGPEVSITFGDKLVEGNYTVTIQYMNGSVESKKIIKTL